MNWPDFNADAYREAYRYDLFRRLVSHLMLSLMALIVFTFTLYCLVVTKDYIAVFVLMLLQTLLFVARLVL